MRNTRVNVTESRMPWWAILGGAVGRWLFRHRWALLPFALLAIVPPAGFALALVAWALSWSYVAGIAAVVVVITAAWCRFGLRHSYDRALAAGVVAYCGAYASIIAADPTAWRLLLLWPFSIVFAPLWWFGPTIKGRVRLDWLRRRFARSPLADDGGHLVDVEASPAGWRAHVRLGRRWQDGKDREHLADVLDVPDGAVIAEPDKRTRNRTVHATVIEGESFGGPEIPHPALAAGALAEGGPWAPGGRSILDPLPLGEYRDKQPAGLRLVTSAGGRHGVLFGKTGSGKSGTVSDVVAGVAATRDGVVFGSDVSKQGGTLKPWADVLRWPEGTPIDDDGEIPALALTAEDTIRQMNALLVLVGQRSARVADSDHDNHMPTEAEPGGVYVIEELASLLTAHPEIEDLVVQLYSLARSAGISIVAVSQGGDWDSIPTKVRQNLMWRALHRMEPDAFRLVAKDLVGRVDMDLFDVPGLLYLADDEGGSVMPLRALALYRNADKRRVCAAYREHVKRGPASSLRPAPTPRREMTTMTSSTRRADARDQARQALDDAAAQTEAQPDFGDRTAAEVFASVPPEVEPSTPEDDALAARIVDRLRQGPASSTQLAEAVGSSSPTVLRRLAALRVAERVHMTGAGAGARWHLTTESAGARS